MKMNEEMHLPPNVRHHPNCPTNCVVIYFGTIGNGCEPASVSIATHRLECPLLWQNTQLARDCPGFLYAQSADNAKMETLGGSNIHCVLL